MVEPDKIKVFAGIDGSKLYFVEIKRSLLEKIIAKWKK
jgi:hypothetical protein